MTAYRFIEPLDVLFLRGNKLFGDPGSFGESLVPPWPSVIAGAIRSRILADDGIDPSAFGNGEADHPRLGTPSSPGPFTIAAFHLARELGNCVESLRALPADLPATRTDDGIRLDLLRPSPREPAVASSLSRELSRWPVLASDGRRKPAAGIWLTDAGWRRYLRGEIPESGEVVESGCLWKLEGRIGIGIDAERRSAEEGRLFTVQAVALAEGCGFLAAVEGVEPPAGGLIRLGGDGRAAALRAVKYAPPEADLEAITAARQCRIVLTAPGLFPGGWRPTGCDGEGRFELGDVCGRLVCAAVPRAETVSGWDLARGRPKPAERAAPAGSVYWLEALDATADGLRTLAARGLWGEPCEDPARRAEGFNRFVFAAF